MKPRYASRAPDQVMHDRSRFFGSFYIPGGLGGWPPMRYCNIKNQGHCNDAAEESPTLDPPKLTEKQGGI